MNAILYVGNAALMRYGLPWTLASLLVIVAAASLWGVRPAFLTLALSTLYGAVAVPLVLMMPLTHPLAFWQEKAEIRHGVVMSLPSMILSHTLADAPGYDLGTGMEAGFRKHP